MVKDKNKLKYERTEIPLRTAIGLSALENVPGFFSMLITLSVIKAWADTMKIVSELPDDNFRIIAIVVLCMFMLAAIKIPKFTFRLFDTIVRDVRTMEQDKLETKR